MESTVSQAPQSDVQPNVIAEVRGGIGWLTLNRPQALNALSLEMIRAMSHALLAWQHDPEVHAVILRGEGGKALCAGGDIRFFHRAATAGDPQLVTFFTEEYRLNHLIFRYAKPYIALMDGVVMGGGMGISQGPRCAWSPSERRWPCRKPTSGCSLTWAADGSWRACRAAWANTWA